MTPRAVERFCAGLSSPVPVSAALTGALDQLLHTARAAWPSLHLEDGDFLVYLAARLPEEMSPLAALGQVRPADLYLACACARRADRAIEAFDAAFGLVLERAVSRFRLRSGLSDDALQMLREKILLGDKTHPPRIASYGGRGALENWLRATAVRALIDLTRQVERGAVEVMVDDDVLLRLPAPVEDPGVELLKRLYREEFKQAFAQAVNELTPRERNCLRQHFVYGLTTEQIGAVYKVHRATAARWLIAARERLVFGIRTQLGHELGVGRDEVESIMRLIESQIEISVAHLLASISSAPTGSADQ